MRFLRSTASAITTAFSCTAAPALAQSSLKLPADDTKYAISYGVRGGCEKLLPRDCDGKAMRLELRAGNWHFGYEGFDETAARTILDYSDTYSWRGHDIASASAHADWRLNTKGYKFILDRNFKATENLHIKLGLYVGHITGVAEGHADARATLHPQHIKSDQQTFHGITIPAIDIRTPQLGAGYHQDWIREGKTWFGGLQASGGWSIPLAEKKTLGLSLYGQAGVERLRYGGGAELIFTSSADPSVGAHPGGPCQRGQGGGHLLSKAKLAFSLGTCVDVVAYDMAEEKKIEFIENKIVGRLNRYIAQGQDYLDQAAPYVRNIPQLPRVTNEQGIEFFGFYPDYQKPRTSLVASFMFRVSHSGALTLSYRHPVGSNSRYDKPVLDATVTYGF